MKRLVLILIIVLVGMADNSPAQTTYSPSLDLYVNSDTGGLWHSRSASQMDSMINNNMMQQMELGRQALVSVITENAAREIEGAGRIKIGRASTKFTPSPQNSIVERLEAAGKTPQEKQEIRDSFNIALSTFNNILKAKRMTPNDSADGGALAFVLSYIVYKGEDPGDTRLSKMRSFLRNEWLKSALHQGTPDAEKQQKYESRAFRTMLAVRASQASVKANVSTQEKQNAQTTAREYAAGVLKEFWTGESLEEIVLSDTTAYGFGDKGDSIISSGKAATTFERSSSTWTVSELANEFNINENEFKNLMQEFDSEVKQRGGATNDAAWVNAVSFALIYEIYTDGKVKLNQKQFNWVLKEMQKDVLSQSDYQSLSNEGKQKYYERWAISAMKVVDEYRVTGPGNARTKMQAQKSLEITFSPRKLEDYELRPNGFVKK